MPPHQAQVNPTRGTKMLVQSDAHFDSAATDRNDADQLATFFATIENTNKVKLNQIVHPPQIIVVGDASPGKRSLLEAISRLPFPVNAKIVCVEISGSDEAPQSTLVDQVNLSDNGIETQQAESAEQYLGLENSINLAVISTLDDRAAARKVMNKVKEHDPQLKRTVGVIVKPDGAKDEAPHDDVYAKLALNQLSTTRLTLGWYVLSSRPEKEISTPELESDVTTTQFFKSGPWAAIQPQNRGVENLRAKVTAILLAQVQQKLPCMVTQIKQHITQHETRLSELRDHQTYLGKIRSNFQDLAREALRGHYMDPFFGGLYLDLSDASYEDRRIKKFRALVKDLNRAFSHVMLTSGHRRRILRDAGGDADDNDDGDEAFEPPNYLAPLIDLYGARRPDPISLHNLDSELEDIAPENQGTGFTGSMHDILTLRLFRDQIRPWQTIANRHIELITHFAKRFTMKLLLHVAGCDVKTGKRLARAYLDPYFEKKAVELSAKLDELLYHYQHGYDLQPLNTTLHGFRDRKNNHHLWGEHRPSSVVYEDSSRSSGAGTKSIADSMAAYYSMSLRVFTDNVVVLAVENCLIRDIPNILSQDTVGMSDKDWQKLIAESHDQVQKGLSQLQKALATCQGIQLSYSITGSISGDIPLLRPAANSASRIRASKSSRASLSPAPSATTSAPGQPSLTGNTSTAQSAQPEASQPSSAFAAPMNPNGPSSNSTVAAAPSKPDPAHQPGSVSSELASRPKPSTVVVTSSAPTPTGPNANSAPVTAVATGTVSANASTADYAQAQPPSASQFGALPPAKRLFGAPSANNAGMTAPPFTNSTPAFGVPSNTTTSPFGAPPKAQGIFISSTTETGTSSFGTPTATAITSAFGGPSSSFFSGAPNKTTTPGFGTGFSNSKTQPPEPGTSPWTTPSSVPGSGSGNNKSNPYKYGEDSKCPGSVFRNAFGGVSPPLDLYTESLPGYSASERFESICLIDKVSKWSPEELRLVDYEKGVLNATSLVSRGAD